MRYRILAVIGALAVSTPAWADAWDFVLINNSGKEIQLVELSPAGANTWAASTLYEDSKPKPIKAAARSTIHFDKAAAQCKYDIRATFPDKTTAVFANLNLCDAAFVTVRFDGANPVGVGS